MSPFGLEQPPPYFRAGSEPGCKGGIVQSDETDEGAGIQAVDSKETITVFVEMLLETGYQSGGLFEVAGAGKEFHDNRICIEPGKRCDIGILPLTETEAGGTEDIIVGIHGCKNKTGDGY